MDILRLQGERFQRNALKVLAFGLIGCLLAVGARPIGHSAALAEEGLFLPEQIATPFDKEQTLASIVRIKSQVYFAITVYNNPRDAAAARATAQKIFLPEGITIWPMVLDRSFLDRLQTDPGLRFLPAFYEVARALRNETSFPSQKFAPLEGAATGFFISSDGYFLTGYHVVREEIEAADRTGGSNEPMTCRFVSFEIPIVEGGQIVGYRPLDSVQLVRNVSAEESEAGLDVALLKADIESPAHLELDLGQLQVDEPIWAAGFPIRTQRDERRRTNLGYPDADGSLRISRGKFLEPLNPFTFASTMDGFSGSRGAPTINQEGRVVGLVQNVYPEKEANRRAIVFAGGMRHVDIKAIVRALGLEEIVGGSLQ